ncbi:TonB-dependent receptor [Melioribacter roseus P3M-2]|uniref:TonB-dependent receptor n=2 Tax=Melioribacter TaxID=1134403 RepID=I7A6P2_MELRP|nr:TonB-dependent receptor [Melioribacter roseus]AFN75551.1 TonB-dependent receptor [Melioribacter roseus P3M-2]
MKNEKVLFFLSLLYCFLFINYESYGQLKGTVQGKVSSEGEALPYANVIILGTSYGASTDAEGYYKISGIPVGTYKIQARYIGFEAKEVTVEIKANKITEINFSLVPTVLEGMEVITITGQAKGQVEAINQQLNSNTIVNVVSKTKIEELPDANAAESVGRLPGVSIIRSGGEGNMVSIRGLEPKFNLITVNGVRIPSTENENRSVDLSMFSVNMLDGIELTKAITPDRDADAVGGIIDFKVNRVQQGLDRKIQVQQGYNGHSKTFYPFKINGAISNRYFDNSVGAYLYLNYEQVDRSAHQFTGNYDVQGTPLPGEEFVKNLTVTNFSLRDVRSKVKRVGATLNLDYLLSNGSIMLMNIFSYLNNDKITYYDGYNVSNVNHTYRLMHDNYDLSLLTNSFVFDYDLQWIKSEVKLSHSVSQRDNPTDYYVEFQENSAFSGDWAEHIYDGPAILQRYARNNLTETGLNTLVKQPSENLERNITGEINLTLPFNLGDAIYGKVKTGSKFRYTNKNANSNYYRSNPGIADSYDPTKGIAGVINAYPDRTFPMTSNGLIQMRPFWDSTFSISSFMNNKYNFGYALNKDIIEELYRRVSNNSYYYSPRGDINDNTVYERIYAGYLMSVINLGSNIMILPGVRYEKELSHYKGAYVIYEDTGLRANESSRRDSLQIRKNENWFPMLHLRFKASSWFDVRLAFTKTIIRPDYQYLVPKYFENSLGLSVIRGNPQLKPAIARNLDLSLAFHSNVIGLFTVSAFYKEIENMFYTISRPIISKDDALNLGLTSDKNGFTLTDPINNTSKAFIRGIEFDLQTRLWYLPGLLNGIVLSLNYTTMNSITYYPRTLLLQERLTTPPWFRITRIDTSRKGRMLDQPNDV